MDDLVSVIVPIYNSEKYLKECLDSIVNQTYKNLEIILVDDGSTDASGAICDEYASRDGRIKVVHEKNGGVGKARNCAIELSKGGYIAFVDSDDCIHLRYIEILLKIASQTQADVVIGGYIVFNGKNLIKDKYFTEEDIKKAERLGRQHLFDKEFLRKETTCLTFNCGKLYRTELFKNVRFPGGIIHEDTFTTWKIMENATQVVYLKAPLYYWRENFDSITRGKFTIKHLSGLDAFIEQFEYFRSNGKQRYMEIVFDEYLDWFFWCYNEMKACNISLESLAPYYAYIRKNVKYIKYSRSLGIKQWLKYRYLAYYKIPRIIYI